MKRTVNYFEVTVYKQQPASVVQVLINPLAYTLATTVCVSVKNVKTTVPSCVQKN